MLTWVSQHQAQATRTLDKYSVRPHEAAIESRFALLVSRRAPAGRTSWALCSQKLWLPPAKMWTAELRQVAMPRSSRPDHVLYVEPLYRSRLGLVNRDGENAAATKLEADLVSLMYATRDRPKR